MRTSRIHTSGFASIFRDRSMVWENFSPKLQQRLQGPVWDKGLRERFLLIASTLLSVSPSSACELTTIYVKFTLSNQTSSPVFAVVWIKNSQKWLVGLAMPPGFNSEKLELQPKNYKYAGLTHCFFIEPHQEIPSELIEWAYIAHSNVRSQLPETTGGE